MMSQLTKILIASTLMAAVGSVAAQPSGSTDSTSAPTSATAPAPSGSSSGASAGGTTAAGAGAMGMDSAEKPATADPYVQKRDKDAAAKKEYQEQKKAAKDALKSEKKHSAAERNAAVAADPAKPVRPGDNSMSGN